MKKIVTFGEVLLRLTAPGNLRFSQARDYVAAFGGSETNVAVSLANFGIPTEFVTRLPDNEIARACVSDLRSHGLRTDGIIYGGDRMGIYFLENGASFRNSKVVYDRAGSSFSTLRPGMIDKLFLPMQVGFIGRELLLLCLKVELIPVWKHCKRQIVWD